VPPVKPIGPVSRVIMVAGTNPFRVVMTLRSLFTLHAASPFAITLLLHSPMNTITLGAKPFPVTLTIWPLVSAILGVT
jgi:hypothetical protein